MKWTAQNRVPLKNYTKWNKLLRIVSQSGTNLYNKIKEFGVCGCVCVYKCYEHIGPSIEGDRLTGKCYVLCNTFVL